MAPKKRVVTGSSDDHPLANIPPGTILGEFEVVKRVGRGEFGFVYEVIRKGEHFALKICEAVGKGATKLKKTAQSLQSIVLHKEYMLYNITFAHPGNPHFVRLPKNPTGEVMYKDVSLRFLVLPLLGRTLRGILEGNLALKDRIPWQTAAAIGIQMLEGMEYVHGKGHVLVDIAAGNVMFGRVEDGEENLVYLTDMGLADKYKGFMSEVKLATGEGTPLYTPVSSMLARPMSPRDDLESLAYLLIHLAGTRDALPWADGGSDEGIKKIKSDLLISKGKLNANALIAAIEEKVTSCISRKEFTTLCDFIRAVYALEPLAPIDYTALKSILAKDASAQGKPLVFDAASAPATTPKPGRKKAAAGSGSKISKSVEAAEDIPVAAPPSKVTKGAKLKKPVVERSERPTPTAASKAVADDTVPTSPVTSTRKGRAARRSGEGTAADHGDVVDLSSYADDEVAEAVGRKQAGSKRTAIRAERGVNSGEKRKRPAVASEEAEHMAGDLVAHVASETPNKLTRGSARPAKRARQTPDNADLEAQATTHDIGTVVEEESPNSPPVHEKRRQRGVAAQEKVSKPGMRPVAPASGPSDVASSDDEEIVESPPARRGKSKVTKQPKATREVGTEPMSPAADFDDESSGPVPTVREVRSGRKRGRANETPLHVIGKRPHKEAVLMDSETEDDADYAIEQTAKAERREKAARAALETQRLLKRATPTRMEGIKQVSGTPRRHFSSQKAERSGLKLDDEARDVDLQARTGRAGRPRGVVEGVDNRRDPTTTMHRVGLPGVNPGAKRRRASLSAERSMQDDEVSGSDDYDTDGSEQFTTEAELYHSDTNHLHPGDDHSPSPRPDSSAGVIGFVTDGIRNFTRLLS